MMKEVLLYSFYLLILFGSVSIQANEAVPCFEKWEVGKEAVLIDLARYTSCSLLFTTAEDSVLALRYLGGNFSDLRDTVQIVDGVGSRDTLASLEAKAMEQHTNEASMDIKRPIYTSRNSAVLELTGEVAGKGYLKIQKAVECPFNLGPSSQCGDIFQDGSCYCVTYVARSWQDQKNFCEGKGFSLLSIETKQEEDTIYEFWGKAMYFWTSLNDMTNEHTYVWASTGVPLNPGYANWHPNQPDGMRSCATPDDDCVHLNYLNGGWNDAPCTLAYEAICEKHAI